MRDEFPEDWTDEDILGAIEEVANNPDDVIKKGPDGKTIRFGEKDGVEIEVYVSPDGEIETGYVPLVYL